MRVLVWGINYAPEVTGIGPYNTALCEHLCSAGHQVEMLTTFAYYPMWRRAMADRGQLWRTDEIHGVTVHRCWHYVPPRVNRWKRMLHEASFVATSLLRALLRPRPDVLVIVSPPLLLGLAASLVSALWRRPYLFHVQDLQPDAALRLGMLKPSAFTRLLYALEAHAYRHATRVSGISDGMITALRAKGVPADKCLLFPNGVQLRELPAPGAFRAKHGFAADNFLVVYSGNLGAKQGLDVLVDAARRVRDPRIRVLFCGDGAERERLVQMAAEVSCVTFLPLLPDAEYWELMADANLAVISQVSGSGGAFFPSKLLTAAVASRPVLSVADEESELAQVVVRSGCGQNVTPGDPVRLAEVLDSLAASASGLAALGAAGRKWVECFELGRVLTAFTAELEKVAGLEINR